MKVQDGVEGSACRLSVEGSSLEASWQVMQDDESGTDTHFFSCSMVLCGEEGPVEVVVPPVAISDDTPIELAEFRQALTVLPGAFALLQTCDILHCALTRLWYLSRNG